MYHIASCSFGKDSLAMILRLIEENKPLDEVVFYDTGMEFEAIYKVRDKILPLLKKKFVYKFVLRLNNCTLCHCSFLLLIVFIKFYFVLIINRG